MAKNNRNTTSIKDFEMNRENPFLKEAIEQVEKMSLKNIKTATKPTKKQFYRLLILRLEKF